MMLLVTVLVGYFTLFADEYVALAKHMLGASTFSSNFLLWRETGYFDQAAQFKPLLHLWSLGIEEQFYFLWPLALILIWKIKKWGIWLIVLFSALSFIMNLIGVQHHETATFYLPITRCWELILGSVLAFLNIPNVKIKKFSALPNFLQTREKMDNYLSVIGILCIVLSIAFLNKSQLIPGFLALVPTLGAMLLIISKFLSLINTS